MPRRVSYKEYLLATAMTLARRHKPVWSWIRWRYVCKCGNELPCRHKHKIPIKRGHWPGEASDRARSRPARLALRRLRRPWPCATRRHELLQEYAASPIALALYMGSYYVSASQDMSWAPAGTLHRRFLGWLR